MISDTLIVNYQNNKTCIQEKSFVVKKPSSLGIFEYASLRKSLLL